MKIWSLLPSATEILFELGLGDEVTGVTHECDYPAAATVKPRVTFSHIDSALSSREIDEQVASRLSMGLPLYGIDEERLRDDPPDLIITQDLCPVCAVSPSDFGEHIAGAGCSPCTLTLNPATLAGVLDSVLLIGEATRRTVEAKALVARLELRMAQVREAVSGQEAKRTLIIEWLDPLMPGGHWTPEMVATAGGISAPIQPGEPSRKAAWEELRALDPEVIVLAPCGFSPERANREAAGLWQLEGWADVSAVKSGQVFCVDGNARYSRPGPRLIEGIEELGRILHPGAYGRLAPPGTIRKLARIQDGTPRFEEYR